MLKYWGKNIHSSRILHLFRYFRTAKASFREKKLEKIMIYLSCMFWRYSHLGQFAPLGGEQTAAQLPYDVISIGYSSQWLWYSVYARYVSAQVQRKGMKFLSYIMFLYVALWMCSKQVSWRTRFLVVGDWLRRFIFGRDTSRIWDDLIHTSWYNENNYHDIIVNILRQN